MKMQSILFKIENEFASHKTFYISQSLSEILKENFQISKTSKSIAEKSITSEQAHKV